MNDKTVYTISEAAKLLNVCEETIRRRIRDGSLKAAKVGHEYRLSSQDLAQYYQTQGGGSLFGSAG